MNRPLKNKSILVLAFSLGTMMCTGAFAQNYTPEQKAAHLRLYREAQAELRVGNFSAAQTKALKLRRLRPGDPYARKLIVQIQTEKRAAMTGTPWERRMRSIVLPKVDLDGESLEDVLEYLSIKAVAKAPEGTPRPSFIVRGDAKERLVSLRLTNVPLSEVLRLVGELADVRFSYEKYAIIGHDLRKTPKTAPDAPVKAPDLEAIGKFPALVLEKNRHNPLEAITKRSVR